MPLRYKEFHRRLMGTKDHIKARSLGGSDNADNIMLAHQYCNSKRGTADVTDELRRVCRKWISNNVPLWFIDSAEEFYLRRYVPPVERSTRIEPDWWSQQPKSKPSEDAMNIAWQGGLCNGR
jgi:hypothetical protein